MSALCPHCVRTVSALRPRCRRCALSAPCLHCVRDVSALRPHCVCPLCFMSPPVSANSVRTVSAPCLRPVRSLPRRVRTAPQARLVRTVSALCPRYVRAVSALCPHCVRTASALCPHCTASVPCPQPHCVPPVSALRPRCIRTVSALSPRCVRTAPEARLARAVSALRRKRSGVRTATVLCPQCVRACPCSITQCSGMLLYRHRTEPTHCWVPPANATIPRGAGLVVPALALPRS